MDYRLFCVAGQMPEAMRIGMQVGSRWILSFLFMWKRRGDLVEWNYCMQLPLVWDLYGCMERLYEKVEDNHSNGVLFYVRKGQVV